MHKHRPLIVAIALAVVACQTSAPRETSKPPLAKPGGYYKDDGPGDNPPANLASIPDAVPRAELAHAPSSRVNRRSSATGRRPDRVTI